MTIFSCCVVCELCDASFGMGVECVNCARARGERVRSPQVVHRLYQDRREARGHFGLIRILPGPHCVVQHPIFFREKARPPCAKIQVQSAKALFNSAQILWRLISGEENPVSRPPQRNSCLTCLTLLKYFHFSIHDNIGHACHAMHVDAFRSTQHNSEEYRIDTRD